MWEIHNNLQISGFLYSCVLGIIYSVVYDLFRTIRIIKPHSNFMVFFEDIIYFLLISITTFIFLLSITNGEIRSYILFGIALGFILFNKLVSRYFIKGAKVIFKLILKCFSVASIGFYWLFSKTDLFISKISENCSKNFKKVLKMGRVLLYTNRK